MESLCERLYSHVRCTVDCLNTVRARTASLLLGGVNMFKRFTVLFAVLLLGLVACGPASAPTAAPTTAPVAAPTTAPVAAPTTAPTTAPAATPTIAAAAPTTAPTV